SPAAQARPPRGEKPTPAPNDTLGKGGHPSNATLGKASFPTQRNTRKTRPPTKPDTRKSPQRHPTRHSESPPPPRSTRKADRAQHDVQRNRILTLTRQMWHHIADG